MKDFFYFQCRPWHIRSMLDYANISCAHSRYCKPENLQEWKTPGYDPENYSQRLKSYIAFLSSCIYKLIFQKPNCVFRIVITEPSAILNLFPGLPNRFSRFLRNNFSINIDILSKNLPSLKNVFCSFFSRKRTPP